MSAAREAAVEPGPAAPKARHPKLRPGPGLGRAAVAENQRARILSSVTGAVTERGYDAVTVREIARLAGVSTRAVYQHYSGKEQCLLDAHRVAVARLLNRLLDSEVQGCEREQSVGLALGALLDEWGRDPRAARLALIEAYAPTPAVLEQTRSANRVLEARIAEAFVRGGDEIRMSPLLIRGVVAGAMGVARSGLLDGRDTELSGLGVPLTQWALSYPDPAVAQLRKLDRVATLGLSEAFFPSSTGGSGKEGTAAPSGDLALLLSAVAKLVAADGYEGLTVHKILAIAGIRRRAFYANFKGLDDCVATAFELRAADARGRMACAAAMGSTSAGGLYRALLLLSAQIARDPVFAKLCFGRIATLGLRGMHCREHFMARVRRMAEDRGLAGSSDPDRVAAEASVNAIWAVLEHKVAVGRAQQLPHLAATLAYMLLAPAIGAPAAIEAIHDEVLVDGSRVQHK